MKYAHIGIKSCGCAAILTEDEDGVEEILEGWKRLGLEIVKLPGEEAWNRMEKKCQHGTVK